MARFAALGGASADADRERVRRAAGRPRRPPRDRDRATAPTTRACGRSPRARPRPPTTRRPTPTSPGWRRRPSLPRSRATTTTRPRSAPTTRPGSRPRRSTPRSSTSTASSRAASPGSRSPRRTGLAVEQTMTDVAALALAAVDGASGYAERTGWRLADVDPAAAAVEADEKAALTRGAVELEPGSYPAVLEPPAFAELLAYFSYDAFSALGLVEERSYAYDKLGEKVFDERFSLADDALDARGLPEGVRLRGHAQAARRARPGRRAHRRRLGPHERRARGRRPADHRARAAELAAPLGPAADLALGRGRRGRVARAAGGARRRRHLRHAPPLPEHRRPARGDRHRDDARRDLPHPRRQDRRAARQPALHRLRAAAAGRAAGPDPRAGADQPERLLRRALPDRAALARGRDRRASTSPASARARESDRARSRPSRARPRASRAGAARRGARRRPRRSGRRAFARPYDASAPRASGTARRGARAARRRRPTSAPRPRSRQAATSRFVP